MTFGGEIDNATLKKKTPAQTNILYCGIGSTQGNIATRARGYRSERRDANVQRRLVNEV